MKSPIAAKGGRRSSIEISGDIEGRSDFSYGGSSPAAKVASVLAGAEVGENDEVVNETVCELANHDHWQRRHLR